MQSPIVVTLVALLVLGIGLFLILPRKDKPGPLAEQIEMKGTVAGVGVEQEDSIVDDAMTSTLQEFLDKVKDLKEEAAAETINKTYSYLSPSLQEAFQEEGVTRDDFVVLFDQETKAFPPSEYEIVKTEVINNNLQEANVRLKYPEEEVVIYNIELERVGNSWKISSVNSGI